MRSTSSAPCARGAPLAGAVAALLLGGVWLGALGCGSGATGDGGVHAGDASAGGRGDAGAALDTGGARTDVRDAGGKPEPDGGDAGATDAGATDGAEPGGCEKWEDCPPGTFCWPRAPGGGRCLESCLSDGECGEGETCDALPTVLDVIFVCWPAELLVCGACESDGECPLGRCVRDDAAGFCAPSCRADRPCADGFVCAASAVGHHCLPAAGSCCAGGALVSCDDGDPCTHDRCDPALGCVHEPAERCVRLAGAGFVSTGGTLRPTPAAAAAGLVLRGGLGAADWAGWAVGDGLVLRPGITPVLGSDGPASGGDGPASGGDGPASGGDQ